MDTIWVILFSCQILTSYGWRPYEIEIFNQTTSSFDENIVLGSTLNTDKSLNVNMEVLKPLPEMYAQFEFYLDSGFGKFEMEVVNRTINICRLFREPRYETILQIFYKIVNKYGNFPTRCPIRKQNYYIRGLLINSEMFPPVFPEKKFLLGLTFLNKSMNAYSKFLCFGIAGKKVQSKQN